MAAKGSRKRKGSKAFTEHRTQKILACIFILLLIIITIAEGSGHDPVGWVKSKLSGGYEKAEDNLTVNFIDVGQGDCVFISAGGETMLIDCGEASESEKVISYLNKCGVRKLDYVVATHPHSDHMGGMSEIIKNYDIGEVIMPYLDDSDIPSSRYFEKFLDECDRKKLSITDAEPGSIIEIGDARAEIIAPLSKNYSGANNYSVGIILTHGKNDFLFTGDAEKLAEEEMLESGRLQHVRVYKAGHHGSDTSSSQDFIDAISPEYAVIMCGEGNSYGHPHDKIIKRLSEYTKNIFRTDLSGSIVFESDGINLQIRTERNN